MTNASYHLSIAESAVIVKDSFILFLFFRYYGQSFLVKFEGLVVSFSEEFLVRLLLKFLSALQPHVVLLRRGSR